MCARYYDLVRNYTLLSYVDPHVGLVNVSGLKSAEIDWPSNMRDCFEESHFNTIVNAYAARACRQMAAMAEWIGRPQDVQYFSNAATSLALRLNALNYHSGLRRFCDGVCEAESLRGSHPSSLRSHPSSPPSTNHTAWHSSVFMLAFDLVAEDKRASVFAYVTSRLNGQGDRPARCRVQPAAHPQVVCV